MWELSGARLPRIECQLNYVVLGICCVVRIFSGTCMHVISFHETGTIILILQIRRLKFSLDLRSDFQVLICSHAYSIGFSSPQLQSRLIELLPRARG